MGLEFGKWLMDVAKYILTALLLATFLGDMNSATTIIASIVLMLGMLGIGLWLVKKSSNNNKKYQDKGESIENLNKYFESKKQQMKEKQWSNSFLTRCLWKRF